MQPSPKLLSRSLACLAATGALVAALTASVTSPAYAAEGVFSVRCETVGVKADDPIVFRADDADGPNPGAAHKHYFTGNKSTSASSTYKSMKASLATTCDFSKDTAAYWMPALLRSDGSVITTSGQRTYYRNSNGGTTNVFKVPPQDLRIIAGYPTIKTGTDGNPIENALGYSCQDSQQYKATLAEVDCIAWENQTGHNGYLKAHIKFPNCWNGRTVDSLDHRSHMAYGSGERCPSGYPVLLPKITQNWQWPSVERGSGLKLSSDLCNRTGYCVEGGRSLHADFWNTWDNAALSNLITKCINTPRVCKDVTDANPLGGPGSH